jgi:2-(1,2-epoxy-1,2-dihydrophenyl)acetyl-CoA isomerase
MASDALTDYETVLFEARERVARITLDRPESLNGWTRQLGEDLLDAVGRCAADPEIRCVVITGAGRAFSSGADLKSGGEFRPDGKPDVLSRLRETYNPLISAVRRIPKPVVAAVNGPAVGIGAGLALACDLLVAAESAYFLLAFRNIGLTLDGGTSLFLPARIGYSRAAELAMLGERVPAATALEWGLVNRVCPDAQLPTVTDELAARLAAGPPGSYAATKELLNDRSYAGLEEHLDREAVLQQERAVSADFAEGVIAFMQKRDAQFTGA